MIGPGSSLTVKVVTGAKHSEIAGWMEDGSLKVKLRAKPIEGKANQELLDLLADKLKISRNRIEIIQGEHSKRKVIRINQPFKPELEKLIEQARFFQDP